MLAARSLLRPMPCMAALALAACPLIVAPSAQGGGSGIRALSYVRKEDNDIAILVRVLAGGTRHCYGDAFRGHTTVHLDSHSTSNKGALQWSWDVAEGVPRGYWRATVACSREGDDQTAKLERFLVDRVPGRRRGRRLVKGGIRVESSRAIPGEIKRGKRDRYADPPTSATRYAKTRRQDLAGLGDADKWVAQARAAGIPTGSRPLPGAIAAFPPNRGGVGPFGHVGYVAAVNGSTITVEDFDGDHAVVRRRTIPWAGLQFIYREGQSEPSAPAPPPPPPATNVLSSHKVVDAPGTTPNAIAWDGASTWIGDADGTVFKLDAAGGAASSAKAPPGTFAFRQGGLVYTGQGFAVFDFSGGNGTIYRFTVAGSTANQTGSFAAPPTDSSYDTFMSWDGSSLWLANGYTTHRLSPSGTELDSFTMKQPIQGIAAHGGSLWIAHSGNLTATVLDKVDATGTPLARYYTRIPLMGGMTWVDDSLFALGASLANYDVFRVDAPG